MHILCYFQILLNILTQYICVNKRTMEVGIGKVFLNYQSIHEYSQIKNRIKSYYTL